MTRGPFDVWAPRPDAGAAAASATSVVEMAAATDGWWTPAEPRARRAAGGRLRLPARRRRTRRVPDPRSRRQPAGVHERSRTYDPAAFAWTDGAWTGRQLAGSVIYELHVGTFTPEGTFDAALGRLDHLRSIGVDLVEVMPVNAFNGTHNWGYDGVLLVRGRTRRTAARRRTSASSTAATPPGSA